MGIVIISSGYFIRILNLHEINKAYVSFQSESELLQAAFAFVRLSKLDVIGLNINGAVSVLCSLAQVDLESMRCLSHDNMEEVKKWKEEVQDIKDDAYRYI